jgi:hypothetical protein
VVSIWRFSKPSIVKTPAIARASLERVLLCEAMVCALLEGSQIAGHRAFHGFAKPVSRFINRAWGERSRRLYNPARMRWEDHHSH